MCRDVIITGGASGIGWATAKLFSERGDRVTILDLNGSSEAANRLGTKHRGIDVDITDENSVTNLFETISKIDVLVNNAGIGDSHFATFDQDIEQFRRVLDIHVSGSFLMARQAGLIMKDAGGGSIINMSSIAGIVGLPRRNAYGAAKAGIAMLTRNLACEWATHNIRVNAVAPGYVGTDLVQTLVDSGKIDIEAIKKRSPQGRLLEPSEIAEAIVFLASSAASAITGVTLSVDGGWAAFGDFGDAS